MVRFGSAVRSHLHFSHRFNATFRFFSLITCTNLAVYALMCHKTKGLILDLPYFDSLETQTSLTNVVYIFFIIILRPP